MLLITLAIYYFTIYVSVYWLLIYLKNKREEKKLEDCPFVSIIVPVYNNPSVSQVINHLLNINYPKDKYEIIVVNDGSTDNTAKVLEKYKNKIKIINKTKNEGKGKALNDGLKIAKGEFVCIVDDDVFIDKNLLKKAIPLFDENTGAVTPVIEPYNKNNFLERLQWIEYSQTSLIRKLMGDIEGFYITPGVGSIYKKEILEKIGGFDENNLTEDLEIGLRLVKEGYKIKCIPLKSYTEVPSSFKSYLKQRLRWYVGFYYNILKYKMLLFNRKFKSVGLFTLPINTIWVVILLYLASRYVYDLSKYIYQRYIDYYLVKDLNFLLFKYYQTTITINLLTIFSFIVLALWFITIYFSLKFMQNKFNKKVIFDSFLFLTIYTVLTFFLWFFSLIYYFIKGEFKWKGELRGR